MRHVSNEIEQRASLSQRIITRDLADRRDFLTRSLALTGAALAGGSAAAAAESSTPAVLPWQRIPGQPFRTYGQPSPFEEATKRTIAQPFGAIAPGTGSSFTPLQ